MSTTTIPDFLKPLTNVGPSSRDIATTEIPGISGRWLQIEDRYDYAADKCKCPNCGSLSIPWGGWFSCDTSCGCVAVVSDGRAFVSVKGTTVMNPTTDPQTAMDHLREVLMILQDLSPMDGCEALEAARKFYNAANPTARVLPSAGWVTRLVSVGPLDWPHAVKERRA